MSYDFLIQSRVFWVLATLICVLLLYGLVHLGIGVFWRIRKKDLGEKPNFKYFYPAEIKPEKSYPFLIFSTFAPQIKTTLRHQRHMIEELVQLKVRRLLKDARPHYLEGNGLSKIPVAFGKYLKFTPSAKGMRFNPRHHIPEWNGKIISQHFDFTASKEILGQTIDGHIKVSIWLIPIAQLTFQITVTENAECEPFELPEIQTASVIFPSYAHEDAPVLTHFVETFKKIGVEYLSDRNIQARSEWDKMLTTYIARSDFCQLFWSEHAARSTYIPTEIRRATELEKPIYPMILVEQGNDGSGSEASEKLKNDLFAQFPELAKLQVTSHSYVASDETRRSAYLMAPFVSSAGAMPSGLVPIMSLAAMVVVSTGLGLYIHNKVNKPPQKDPEIVVRPEEPSPPPTPVPAKTYNIAGTIRRADGSPMRGVVVTLTDGKSEEATTDNNGRYEFRNLKESASYVVTPSQKSGVFSPRSHKLQNLQKDESVTFNLQTFTISGLVTTQEGRPIPHVKMILSGSRPGTASRRLATIETDARGSYSFDGIESVYTYTITPEHQRLTFDPANRDFRDFASNQIANFQLVPLPPSVRASVKPGPWPRKQGERASFVVTITNVGGSEAKKIEIAIIVDKELRIKDSGVLEDTDEGQKDRSFTHKAWKVEGLRVNETKTLTVEAVLLRDLTDFEIKSDSAGNLVLARAKVRSYEDAKGKRYPLPND